MQKLSGGQRVLRPQARFGDQPGLKIPALRPEMAALSRNYQQTPGKFCACPGRRGRRPLPLGKVHHAFFRIHSGKLPAWSGAPPTDGPGILPGAIGASFPTNITRHIAFFHVQHSKVSLAGSGPLPAAFFLLQFLISHFSFLILPQLLTPTSYLLTFTRVPPNRGFGPRLCASQPAAFRVLELPCWE